jgi:hypothetical protein
MFRAAARNREPVASPSERVANERRSRVLSEITNLYFGMVIKNLTRMLLGAKIFLE